MEEKHIVAIEIGSSKLRGALGVIEPNGTLNVVAVHDEPLIDSVRYGQIRNVEEVGSRIDTICKRLQKHPLIQSRKIDSVYVGLSGLSLTAVPKTVEKQLNEGTEISAEIIDEMRHKAAATPSSGREILLTLPREFNVDNRAAANPVGTIGSYVKATFNAIEAQPSLKNNIERVIRERLGLKINDFIVAPIAQAEAVLRTEEMKLGCVFVDFGAETTTIAIYKNGALRYLATLPIGSRNITRDLMSLNMLEDRAEHIKRTSGNALNNSMSTPRVAAQDSPDINEVNNYVAARAGEIVANILAQVEYSGFKDSDLPEGFVLVGGGVNLRGFSDLLHNKSGQKVRRGEILPSKVRVSDTSIQSTAVIDVISLLINAAKNNPDECVEKAAPGQHPHAQRHYEDEPRPHYSTDSRHDDRHHSRPMRDDDYYDDDPDVSRIGRYDGDEDDVFLPKKEGRRSEKDGKSKKENKKKDDEPKKPGILDRFRDRMANLLNDDFDEEDDEE